MIISQLNGGLGNQMFQYATGKLIAKKNNIKFFVDPNYLLSFRFNREWNRIPEILKLNLKHGVAKKTDIRKFIFFTGISYVDMYIKKFRLFEKNVCRISADKLKSDEFIDNLYLFGFVSGDFFGSIKKELEQEFSLNKKRGGVVDILDLIKSGKSVSIHVRRGDILKIKNGYVLPIDYYKKAVRSLEKKKKGLKFYIFSDDIDWCEKNFGWIKNKTFVKGNSPTEDFELMKNCKYNILANSTLSWWVGYLSGADVVIAPSHFGLTKDNPSCGVLVGGWVDL